jgi:hypothetical protein
VKINTDELIGWNPGGCTLLPIVRDLIMRAHMAEMGKERAKSLAGYQPVWLPDLPIGPQYLNVAHDCTRMPVELLGVDTIPVVSMGHMDAYGTQFVMSIEPEAVHYIYVAACANCKTVFYASAWDRRDTLQAYAKSLKRKKT